MPVRKITVLQLINSLTMGGAERVAYDLAKGMDKTKFQVLLCGVTAYTDDYTTQIITELKEHQVTPLSLNRTPWKRSVKVLWRLIKIIKEYRVDLINTHCPTPDFYGRLAAIYCCRPAVSTFHNIKIWEKYPRLGPLTEYLLQPMTTRFIAISNEVKKWALKELRCDPKKITIVYNGINTNYWQHSINKLEKRRSLGFSQKEKLLTVVGRLTEQKGHSFLLKAMADVVGKHPGVRLLIIGEGELRPQLEQQVTILGLLNKVFFLGKRTDIAEIYGISDLFVLPSLWEGLPLVMLEAMTAGVPVIATAVAGVPEVIDHKKNGLLVPPASPEELSTAICYLLEHPQEAREMATRAKKLVQEQFDAVNMVRGYEAVYQEIVKQ